MDRTILFDFLCPSFGKISTQETVNTLYENRVLLIINLVRLLLIDVFVFDWSSRSFGSQPSVIILVTNNIVFAGVIASLDLN